VCGGRGKVSITKPAIKCAFCGGTGIYRDQRLTCTVCGGKGMAAVREGSTTCPHCGGKGVVAGEYLPCAGCGGKGVVAKQTRAPARKTKAGKT